MIKEKIDLRKFRDVTSFKGLYKVNRQGDIYSIKNKDIIIPQKSLYASIKLYKKGTRTLRRSIHRIVAEAYHKNPENKPLVNHKDGNKLNNNDWNLEWNTHSENAKHAYEIGLVIRKDRIKPNAKIVKMLETNGRMIRMFASIREADRTTGVDQSHITKVCKGTRLTAGGYKWEYKA